VNHNPKRPITTTITVLLAALTVLLAMLPQAAAQAAADPPRARDRILIVGSNLQPAPAHQVVPKNLPTIVSMLLVQGDDADAATADALSGQLPAGTIVRAELRGPALPDGLALTALPNQPLAIPPLPLAGLYTLENIRMERDGEVLLQGNPDSVTIEVIDKLLDYQVTSRALSADEIEELGIVFDESNFQAINFAIAFGLEDEVITIDFPVLIPKPSEIDSLTAESGQEPLPIPDLLEKSRPKGFRFPQGQLPSVSGFILKTRGAPEGRDLDFALPGAVIIPGNVGFLNQFFSVQLVVSNVAPEYADLVVRDLQAEILLPSGDDTVIDTGDDPLRMARLGDPPAFQDKVQPLVQAGADGELGTGDDIPSVAPGENGVGEYLVEGLIEGTHVVEFAITGVLDGLPGGPVEVEGRAAGVIDVRNPTFALTFNHPGIVSAGEEYDLHVTVSNVSDTPANYVSVNLLPRSISGAQLISDQTVQVRNIAPADSAFYTFRLRALKTGRVTATSYDSDGLPGTIELRSAVGELGIPLSPNSLILPDEVKYLPQELREAGLALLGQAHALATAPITPAGLLPMDKQMVYERARDLGAAGQRIQFGESLRSVARDLALDYAGNGLARTEGAQTDDYPAFDQLVRRSTRGARFVDMLATILSGEASDLGALAFQAAWAEQAVSRPGHLSVVLEGAGGATPGLLRARDAGGRALGLSGPGAEIAREIPYGFFTEMGDAKASQLALIGAPGSDPHTVEVLGTANGQFDLGIVVPRG
jgi:hypothetical protein